MLNVDNFYGLLVFIRDQQTYRMVKIKQKIHNKASTLYKLTDHFILLSVFTLSNAKDCRKKRTKEGSI